MSIFQIVSILFALFMLYVVNIHRRKLQLSQVEVTFWYSMWIVFIVFALFPKLLLGITDVLHFSRVFDLLVVMAFMILTAIVITSYFIQRHNTQKLEEVVRKIAIHTSTQSNHKSKR